MKEERQEIDHAAAGGETEFSLRAAAGGIIIGVLFGAANAYLGLRVGLTVSASIPAAVMSVALFRALARLRLSRSGTILENNLVQTIGSAGESLAAGIIFTMPALILLGQSPSLLKMFLLGSLGGILGVLFMIPLRRYLIVREHGRLLYPEGTACAGVLVAGQAGAGMGRMVFAGLAVGAVYEFLSRVGELWKDTPRWRLGLLPGAELSLDTSPALVGVGYVIGPRIAAVMFGGGAFAWLVFIPAIRLFGSDTVLYPASVPLGELEAADIWKSFVRYIGAGAVVVAGLITLLRSLPVILSSARALLPGRRSPAMEKDREEASDNSGRERAAKSGSNSDRDLPPSLVLLGLGLVVLALMILPSSLVPGRGMSSLLAVAFAFFFVAVSSRIVGLIGSSSNPISGMTIAALLAVTLLFKLRGWTDADHQAAALAVGAIVCIAAAVAGDISQDLKTGFLVRATPWKMQTGELLGVLTSAAVIGFVVLRLQQAYGIGSVQLPAPQATLMAMVVRGVLSGDLPWTLLFLGGAAALIMEILGIPSLPFAVGLYLPFSMSTPIMVGGLMRFLAERSRADKRNNTLSPPRSETEADRLMTRPGVLFASGLIAGSAFVGMAAGLIRSIPPNAGWELCRSWAGVWRCAVQYPGTALTAVWEKMRIGPEWAGESQDLVAGAAVLLIALMLLAVSFRGKSRRAPEEEEW